jgi:hypothetical protein
LKARLATCCDHSRASAVLHEAKSQNQAGGPNSHENEQRQWAVKAQKRFPCLAGGNEAYSKSPDFPGGSKKETRETKLTRHAPRQDDGLKRIPQHDQKNRDTCDKGTWSWNHVGHCTRLAARSMSGSAIRS